MQLPKISGWDQTFSDHDNYLPLIFFFEVVVGHF